MRRGTTPTLELELDTSLNGCEFWVTIENNKKQITKREDDCELSEDGKTIYVYLTQAETLSMNQYYPVSVQVRFKMAGKAFATNIVDTNVGAILLEGEI